jgi:hypothetical protein
MYNNTSNVIEDRDLTLCGFYTRTLISAAGWVGLRQQRVRCNEDTNLKYVLRVRDTSDA